MLIGCSASFLLLLLLSCLTEPAESRTLHLDSCSVSVHTHELRKYYAHIRSNAVSSASSHAIKTSGKNLHECNVRLKWQKVVVTDPLFFFFFCDRFQKTTRSEWNFWIDHWWKMFRWALALCCHSVMMICLLDLLLLPFFWQVSSTY